MSDRIFLFFLAVFPKIPFAISIKCLMFLEKDLKNFPE